MTVDLQGWHQKSTLIRFDREDGQWRIVKLLAVCDLEHCEYGGLYCAGIVSLINADDPNHLWFNVHINPAQVHEVTS